MYFYGFWNHISFYTIAFLILIDSPFGKWSLDVMAASTVVHCNFLPFGKWSLDVMAASTLAHCNFLNGNYSLSVKMMIPWCEDSINIHPPFWTRTVSWTREMILWCDCSIYIRLFHNVETISTSAHPGMLSCQQWAVSGERRVTTLALSSDLTTTNPTQCD